MKSRPLSTLLTAVVTIFFLSTAGGSFADELSRNFQEAPMILPGASIPLGGAPLWHTNGPLTSELINEFFEKGAENNFAGYTFLPLGATKPKFLSEEYFGRFGEVLEQAKKRGMKIVFYDDVDYPSGSAGRTLPQRFPADTLKRLDMQDWTVRGPARFSEKIRVPLGQTVLYGKPEGVLQAAVAMNTQTFERIDVTKNVQENTLTWDVPEGEWRLMVFVCVADGHGLIDYMNPDAVKDFLTITYDLFYQRFPEHFGTTIPLCFFDDITNTQTEGGRNWTLGFNAKYSQLYGHSAACDYPAAFLNIGPDTAAARVRLWTTRNELFADGYPKVVHEWCQAHGIQSSGHPQGPYTIQPNNMCGDEMLTHRSSDAPLFDSIHYYGHGRDGFKVPTSAAFNFDRPICVVEIYGNYRNNQFDDTMLFRSGMEIFARGGNFLLPHGIWSDPATMYIPPDISWRNPALHDRLPEYGRWVSRCSLLLQGGRHVADFAMLYPIDALKAFYCFYPKNVPGEHPYGLYIPRETDYMAVGSELTSGIHRDFTILHPTILDGKCSINSESRGTILALNNVVNQERFEVVILTGADVISWSNLQKIRDFYDRGGKVLATTHLPRRSADGQHDEEVCQTIQHIFGLDPRTVRPHRAWLCGQEDIVQYDNYEKLRELNADLTFEPTYPGVTLRDAADIHRERAIFLANPTTQTLRAAADALVDVPDVKLIPVGREALPRVKTTPRWEYPISGMVQYIHKVKEGRDVYYLANSSDESVAFDLQVRGTFQTLEFWDPLTGEITPVPADRIQRSEDGRSTIVRNIELRPIQAMFVVGGNTP